MAGRRAIPPVGTGLLAGSAVLSALLVAWQPAGAPGVLAASAAALMCAAGLGALASAVAGWRAALTSPPAIVVLLLACVFVLRPLSLVIDPGSATYQLVVIDFAWSDVTRAVAMGSLAFGVFGAAFLLVWRSPGTEPGESRPLPADRRLVRGAAVSLVLGTFLWGLLFQRNGGFNKLLDDPASLHLEQFGGGYGVIGFMICLATSLVLLWAWLQRRSRELTLMLAIAVAVSGAATLLLQTRGPVLATVVAAAAMVVASGRLDARRTGALCLAALVLALGFAYMRTVREYAQYEPLGTALESAALTDPLSVFGGDFSEVENFVALDRLVPDDLPWLSGSSLRDVPASFLPRQLWPDKPRPVDFELSEAIYGPASRAGTPFTLAGELYWNFGVAGMLAGMALLGALFGAVWAFLRRRPRGMWPVVGAVVVGYTYLILTRPLGPMLLTLAMALAGVVVVSALTGVLRAPRVPQGPSARRAARRPASAAKRAVRS